MAQISVAQLVAEDTEHRELVGGVTERELCSALVIGVFRTFVSKKLPDLLCL